MQIPFFEKVCALTERALRMAIVRWKARTAEKAIGETAARCYLPLNETDGRLLHAMMASRGEMDRSDGPRGRRKAAAGRGIG